MSVLDEYLIDPKVSLLNKTRIQAQVLVPVLRALREEIGKDAADALVKKALRDWSKQLFITISDTACAAVLDQHRLDSAGEDAGSRSVSF
jgi:hypothetical protein